MFVFEQLVTFRCAPRNTGVLVQLQDKIGMSCAQQIGDRNCVASAVGERSAAKNFKTPSRVRSQGLGCYGCTCKVSKSIRGWCRFERGDGSDQLPAVINKSAGTRARLAPDILQQSIPASVAMDRFPATTR